MRLSAREKRNQTRTTTADPPANARQQQCPTPAGSAATQTGGNGYTQSIYIRCNAMLYNTLQNTVASAHTAEDFTYVSVSDLIRAALEAYAAGDMPLTELSHKGEKISTTIRVDSTLKAFYTSLPDRMRSKLVERAIRTFIKR